MKTKEKVYEILSSFGCMDVKTDNARLQEDLALDSLAMVTLLIELEDIFHIQLDEADMNPFDLITIGDIVRLIEKYGGDQDE
jgi:acyl carrier protein